MYSPGSRRRAARSMRPGRRLRPLASMVRWRVKPAERADADDLAVGDVEVPLASRAAGRVDPGHSDVDVHWSKTCCQASAQHAHDGHAQSDAEGDLRQDHRLTAVGHGGVDLDAAVHRPGASRWRRVWRGELVGGEAPDLEELLGAGQQGAVHALVLQAQHHHHVHVPRPSSMLGKTAHAHFRRRWAAGSWGR